MGLLIVEFSEYSDNNMTNSIETSEHTEGNQDNNIVVDSERKIRIGNRTEDLVEWVLGKSAIELNYVFPCQRKCYLATYKNNGKTEDSEVKELDIKNVVLDNFIMSGEGSACEKASFFSHYFQMFWLCILQKTEILHISHMAGRISRKKSALVMKQECIRVNKEYVLFYNQYDFIECTYDKMGETLYKDIRKK